MSLHSHGLQPAIYLFHTDRMPHGRCDPAVEQDRVDGKNPVDQDSLGIISFKIK